MHKTDWLAQTHPEHAHARLENLSTKRNQNTKHNEHNGGRGSGVALATDHQSALECHSSTQCRHVSR